MFCVYATVRDISAVSVPASSAMAARADVSHGVQALLAACLPVSRRRSGGCHSAHLGGAQQGLSPGHSGRSSNELSDGLQQRQAGEAAA